jgi:signal transduction histidine kinase
VLRARRIHILQLLQNLIENSLKYRREVVPVVRVLWEEDDNGLTLTVSDNGIGIQKEYLSLIFGAFKRLHGHASYPGAGIGLSLCQRITEKYNGKIWVDSVPGEGSRFYVRLPSDVLSGGIPETATQAAG